MDPIPTPHDRFFRESFGRREIAQDFLSHQLPEDLLAEIDLETLAIGKDSYVSNELRTSYVDLVYTVDYRGGELKIYLLFEHKSHGALDGATTAALCGSRQRAVPQAASKEKAASAGLPAGAVPRTGTVADADELP